MKTKILQINYPSSTAEDIGTITAAIRERLLSEFGSNKVSFSFSSNKQSGYLMVYVVPPALSIRVSNHSPTGQPVDENAIITKKDVVILNAEHQVGKMITDEVLNSTIETIKKMERAFETKYE